MGSHGGRMGLQSFLSVPPQLGTDASSTGVSCTSAPEQQDPPETQMFLSSPSLCLPSEVAPPMAEETRCESVLQLSQVCRHARGPSWLSLLGTAVIFLLSLSS